MTIGNENQALTAHTNVCLNVFIEDNLFGCAEALASRATADFSQAVSAG
jgi:hypothetical protein